MKNKIKNCKNLCIYPLSLSAFPSNYSSVIFAMKIAQISPKSINLNPKRLFRSKKSRSSPSREDPSSFGSVTSSSSCSGSNASTSNEKLRSGCEVVDLGTPRSVLLGVLGDWSDSSADIQFEPVPNISRHPHGHPHSQRGWPSSKGFF
jgi:hypothetical protein